jgi:Protein of unknown function (DUF2924)
MARRSSDPAAIDAEVDHVRSLGIVALRTRWRAMFDVMPPAALTKDIIARMIAFRIQEEAFGGLEKGSVTLLERLARGDKPGELNRRLKPGTVLVREYKGERHTVTVVPDGFLWRETTYASLSTIARTITGTAWNGPRFFGLRMPGARDIDAAPESKPVEPDTIGRTRRRSPVVGRASHRSDRGRGRKRG